jgi:hypothetical protein
VEDDFGLVLFEYEVPMEGRGSLPLGDSGGDSACGHGAAPGFGRQPDPEKAHLRRMGSINLN